MRNFAAIDRDSSGVVRRPQIGNLASRSPWGPTLSSVTFPFVRIGRVEYNERRPHSALGYRTPNEYAGTQMNRFDAGCALPNPAPLAAAGVRGELRINATRWQTNEKQNTNEPAELPVMKCLTSGVMARPDRLRLPHYPPG